MFENKNEKGFTLIELIVVIAIIAILAAVVVPNIFSLTDKAKESSAKALASAVVASSQVAWAQALGGQMIYPVPTCTAVLDESTPAVVNMIDADATTDWTCIDDEGAHNIGGEPGEGEEAPIEGGDDYIDVPADGVKWYMTGDPDYQVFYSRPEDDKETFIVTYNYGVEGENANKAGGNIPLVASPNGH